MQERNKSSPSVRVLAWRQVGWPGRMIERNTTRASLAVGKNAGQSGGSMVRATDGRKLVMACLPVRMRGGWVVSAVRMRVGRLGEQPDGRSERNKNMEGLSGGSGVCVSARLRERGFGRTGCGSERTKQLKAVQTRERRIACKKETKMLVGR